MIAYRFIVEEQSPKTWAKLYFRKLLEIQNVEKKSKI